MKRSIPALSILLAWALGAWAEAPATLTTLRAIHGISNAEASHNPAVAFEATVTYFRGYERTLFVQDEGMGLYVAATTGLALVPGDRILIRGVARASFRPFVESSDIALLHHGSPPQPVTVGFKNLVNARVDCVYVKVKGTVRSAEMRMSSGRTVTQIELGMDGGYAGVVMDNSDASKLNGLLDAEVEISGVASGVFDGKMQATGVLIHTPAFSGVKIISAPREDAWATPVTRMDEVLSALNIRDFTQRVRVLGTITYYQPASMAILQDGSRSIRVLTHAINPLRVGDRAEAIGIPFVDNGFLALKLGLIRSTGATAPIVPIPVTWKDLASGKHSYDLVSIEGRVVSQVRVQAEDVYIVSAGDRLFSATVRHPYVYEWGVVKLPPPMPDIASGSMVRLTGVAILDDGNPYNGESAFAILLRTASDVIVIKRPPLLTVRNLVLLVILLLAVVVAVGARGLFIERKVRRETVALAYIEQRRSRILEDINGSRPLAAVIEQITELVSFKLKGAPCWCQIADGAQLGNCPFKLTSFRVVQMEIPAHSAPPLGNVFAAFDPLSKPRDVESEALFMAAALAALAIETSRLYTDLRHRSEFDLLTDTHNRFSLDKRLDSLIAEAREAATVFGFIYIDLDKFKQINDLCGHHTGDRYLQEVAMRMKRQLRSHDLLARIGGDEFAALIPMVRGRAEVEEIAQRLERCLDDPFIIDGYSVHGSASLGIALYPRDGATRDTLLKSADAAMYAAKNTHRGVALTPLSPLAADRS
jgi:diguanylate cyclase (GGDEF)-like protein